MKPSSIQTEILINAPIEKVWSMLINFSDYPNWNPFIRSIIGKAELSASLTVTIQPPNKKIMTFRPKIIALSNYELTWIGRLGFPGIFDGKHQFILNKISDNMTRFIHSESFSGILSKPIFSMLNQSTHAGFIAMNNALKQKCENS